MEHEDYVTYDQAIKLKELGFNWECYQYYNKDKKVWSWTAEGYGDDCRDWNDNIHATLGEAECSAPTLSQAQKWLREVKKITILIDALSTKKQFYWKLYDNDLHFNGASNVNYNTYEETLSTGVDEALELLMIAHNHFQSH